MSDFSDDLLRASSRLTARRSGQKGPLRGAYVRRSVSTTYYAIFHFVLADAALRLVGTGNALRERRRYFIRTMSHAGLATTFGKLKGATIDKSVEGLFRSPTTPSGVVSTPQFVQHLATTFLDAKSKREDADYDLNAQVSETDARRIRRRVARAMADWESATSPADRDAKNAVALLLTAKGRLREQ